MIEIRPAEQKEMDLLSELEREIFPDFWSKKALEGHFSSPVGRGWLCLFQGKAAGYLLASLAFGEGEVLRIGILPEYRRRGLGGSLLSHFLKEGKKEGAEFFFLEVRESNTAARSLYESFGFEKTGERKNYYRDPCEGAVLYQKTCKKEVDDENSGL